MNDNRYREKEMQPRFTMAVNLASNWVKKREGTAVNPSDM